MSIQTLQESGFKNINNYLQISKNLVYLQVGILEKIDKDIIVRSLADKFLNFAGKWSRIKYINNANNQDANEV